jgi:hypothetical protein
LKAEDEDGFREFVAAQMPALRKLAYLACRSSARAGSPTARCPRLRRASKLADVTDDATWFNAAAAVKATS